MRFQFSSAASGMLGRGTSGARRCKQNWPEGIVGIQGPVECGLDTAEIDKTRPHPNHHPALEIYCPLRQHRLPRAGYAVAERFHKLIELENQASQRGTWTKSWAGTKREGDCLSSLRRAACPKRIYWCILNFPCPHTVIYRKAQSVLTVATRHWRPRPI